jgi:probable HAF family extracellular repeat protein
MKRAFKITWLVILLTDFTRSAHAGDQYTCIDLGAVVGTPSAAYSINDSGQVVGDAGYAFLYSNNQVTDLGGLGGSYSIAYSINNNGQIVGEAELSGEGGYDTVAFLYSGGKMINLLNTLSDCCAYCINNHGMVAGGFINFNEQGFEYTIGNGTLSYLNCTCATAINDNGEVAGWFYNPSWSEGCVISNGVTVDIPPLYGFYEGNRPQAINNYGQVVGYTSEGSTTEAYLYSGGQTVGLGTLGGLNSWAYGINRSGNIVGSAQTTVDQRAFIYSNGHMTDLNAITSNLGLFLECAYGINSSGQIVGEGYDSQGTAHGFLLTPIPLPASPILTIAVSNVSVLLSWPTNAPGFTLQSNPYLSPVNWTTVSPAPVILNGQYIVTNSMVGTQMFYRLVGEF